MAFYERNSEFSNLVHKYFKNELCTELADGVNAAIEGLVDDVIDPADTRKMVIAALELMSSKRDSNPPKKHGNMPL